jgi:hypothetical protein
VKYGITSTVTLEATGNPDFSQVESDAFQVEVNQRFPVFYDEKRPFFMEGLGVFNLAGQGGDASMQKSVHTRRIVDPDAGLKLTGTAGRQTFAVLSAADASAADSDRLFTIGRALATTATVSTSARSSPTPSTARNTTGSPRGRDIPARAELHMERGAAAFGFAGCGRPAQQRQRRAGKATYNTRRC